jgi:polygalacturonase
MRIPRRNFLRTGLGAAAFGAAGRAWPKQLDRLAAPDAAQATGWSQVPAILAGIVPPKFPARDFVITDYGASDEKNFDSNGALKTAIRACNKAGGGRVVVPGGTWLSNGPIHLLSNVNLFLEDGAEVLFGTHPADYLPVQLVRWQGIRCYNYSPLIYAYQQENIAITGTGKFNGQGTLTWNIWSHLQHDDWILLQSQSLDGVPVEKRIYGAGHFLRPGMFEPYECQNILVQGVTFEGSPFWTMHPTFCSNVTIQQVTVLPGAKNDDGCDPDSCQNVWIAGCSFTTVDDNISLKSGLLPDADGAPACENIVIQDCVCQDSVWSGLTIGSNTSGFIRNVFMEDCMVVNCENAHYIKSWSNFGGGVVDVYIRNNKVVQCQHLLTMQPDLYPAAADFGPPVISHISMQDVTCESCTDTAFLLQGDVRRPIEDVILENIAVQTLSKKGLDQIANILGLQASGITVAGVPVQIVG